MLKRLLRAKANVNKIVRPSYTPAYRAASCGHVHVLKTLVHAKADMNIGSSVDGTPTCRAASKGQVKVLEFLARAKADLDLSCQRPQGGRGGPTRGSEQLRRVEQAKRRQRKDAKRARASSSSPSSSSGSDNEQPSARNLPRNDPTLIKVNDLLRVGGWRRRCCCVPRWTYKAEPFSGFTPACEAALEGHCNALLRAKANMNQLSERGLW